MLSRVDEEDQLLKLLPVVTILGVPLDFKCSRSLAVLSSYILFP
jgi:hypothetical protein